MSGACRPAFNGLCERAVGEDNSGSDGRDGSKHGRKEAKERQGDGPENEVIGHALEQQPQFEPQCLVQYQGFLQVASGKLEWKPGESEALEQLQREVSSEVDWPRTPRTEALE